MGRRVGIGYVVGGWIEGGARKYLLFTADKVQLSY